MSLPQVIFNKDSSIEARSETLVQLESWLDSALISAVKTQVLRGIINYAKQQLIQRRLYSLDDVAHFTACAAIFNRRELPDLLFLQHALHQLGAIADETSQLKKAMLPMLMNYKRPLMLPLLHQMEKASFGLNVAVLFIGDWNGLLLAMNNFFATYLTAESRIERLLDDRLKLSLEAESLVCARVGNEEGLQSLQGFADRESYRRFGFFNRVVYKKEQLEPSPRPLRKQEI